jgi:glycosyltransferase involved in cell wall biosynthesis
MRILHCCLAAVYVDNFGYQENILPRIHKSQGHDVMILASTEILKPGVGHVYTKPACYNNEDGIPVKRVPYLVCVPVKIAAKLRIYKDILPSIVAFNPDVIFMHDAQTAAVYAIIKYLKHHPQCRLYVDSHTDFVNSAKSWVSKNILHGILYKKYVRKTIPFARRYYGTLPARVAFYRDFYGTPADKTEYLPLGVDDVSTPMSERDCVKKEIREELGINQDDFVIVSGGKLETRKNTTILMQAFNLLSKKDDKLKLLLYGSVSPDISEQFEILKKNNSSIIHIGWVPAKETYKYFFASDLACFPGTHSTLWEEAVGYGIPAIFKLWDGITQIDLQGNCVLLNEPITDVSLSEVLSSIILDKEKYNKMLTIARTKGMEMFSYSRIAKYSIEQ